MRKVLLAGAVAVVALVATTASVGAGLSAQMAVTPDPVTVGAAFSVRNVAGPANTCEGGVVQLTIVDADTDEVVDTEQVTPDGDGSWSVTGTAAAVGSYVIEGQCAEVVEEPLASPQALPTFTYAPVPFQVVPVEPTTTTTTTATTVVPDQPATVDTTEPPADEGSLATPTFTG
jgi:hypothetical protein